MKKEKKILIAASEAVPFAKVGGLADVVGTLPGAMEKVGAEVRIVIPLYKSIDQKKFKMKKVGETFQVPMAGEMVEVSVKSTKISGTKITAYFIECDKYFGREGIYEEDGVSYEDNDERFALFSRAVLEMLPIIGYKPDVIHCNDWHTGLIPTYLKVVYGNSDFHKDIASVMTIHNIAHQGVFPPVTMEKAGLPWEIFNPDGVEYWGNMCYLKAGLVFADVISTVSETYAQEIQSSNVYGSGMEGILAYRHDDLYGILNGIDTITWDPQKDEQIASNYDSKDLRGKSRCKKALQKDGELQVNNIPVIGMVNRLDSQKGIDLVVEAMDKMMGMDIQFVLLGTGNPEFEDMLKVLSDKHKDKMSVHIGFDDEKAHQIYAGCDIFLMPSRFEPCGLGQMIALRYGSLPLVNKTGGLADTVVDYDEEPSHGNGFVMKDYSSQSMVEALERAVALFSNKRKWNAVVKNAMQMDLSWKNSAKKYLELYASAVEKKMPAMV